MNKTLRLGSFIFAAAMVTFGIQHFVYSDFILGLVPVPAAFPLRSIFVYVTGIALIVAGLGIILDKKARESAILLAVLWWLCVLFLQLPIIFGMQRFGGEWTNAFEAVAYSGAALVLVGMLSTERPDAHRWEKLIVIGRIIFALSLPVFGIQHFMHASFIAAVIPRWMPLSRQFWVDFTGFAHIAAGVSIGNNILPRLGATLLSLMFGLWVIMLHAPRVLDNPNARNEWTSAVVALAMCGAALTIAASFPMLGWFRRAQPRDEMPQVLATER